MASITTMRPATNSGSTTASNRRPSLTSFPASRRPDAPIQRPADMLQRRRRSSASRSSVSHDSPPSMQPQSRKNGLPARTHQARSRRIRSQYPADGSEKHVEYILVASFDIDRGSIMEHQYPGPVGGDEVMLAELMLPDQTHTRQQDWTIFFLHKDADAEGETQRQRRARRKRRRKGEDKETDEVSTEEDTEDEDEDDSEDSDEFDDFEPVDLDGPPLVYVLNLVNTKQDNTVKRGAIVKAMAICTRHSFLHIYKPLLLLALEQYFAHPTIDTLATLYDSVNNMDLSLMPRLNPYESFILQASNAKDLFVEKFEAMIAQRLAKQRPNEASNTSPTLQHSRTRYGLPRDTHELESVINYANIPIPVKIPTALAVETVGDFSLIKLITIFSTPHSTSPVAFSPTHPHLTTSGPNTHPIVVLLNALLTQKRVIFLGHTLPSSEVAEAVLAACALASGGMLRGFTRFAFPYTDLTKIDDLLKVPGFIAGVTNPAFAHKNEWWDLLCDINTGRMKISTRIESAPPTEGVALFQQSNPGLNVSGSANHGTDTTGDQAFMNSVMAAINDRHGENAVRIKFRLWISKFTRLAAAFEDVVYGASALHIQDASTTSAPNPPFASSFDTSSIHSSDARSPANARRNADLPAEVLGHGYVWPSQAHKSAELAAHATRIEGWRTTRSYYNFVQDLAAFYSMRAVKTVDLQHLHDKLAKLRLTPDVSRNIYLAICGTVHTDAEINQLLAMIANGMWDARIGPQGTGSGLFYIAYGLFHPAGQVREAVADLLARIKSHEAGRHFWAALGKYIKVAWSRVMRSRDGTAGNDETF